MPADAAMELRLRGYRNLVTSTAPDAIESRERQKLPAVSDTQVTYITDDAICAKAEKAYTAAVGSGGQLPSGRAFVIKVGNVYVVWDPAQRAGEYVLIMTVSDKFEVLAQIAG